MHPARTLLVVCALAITSFAQLTICGDVDQNQRVNVLDSFLTARAAAGLTSLTLTQQAQADANSSGGVEVTDALRIARFVVLLDDSLSCMGFGTSTCDSPSLYVPSSATVNDTMVVSDTGIINNNLQVYVDLPHSDIRDLRVTLIHPDTTQVILHERTGPRSLGGVFGTYPTTLTPFQSLTALNGKSMNGTWTLRVNDNQFGDDGMLRNWCLSRGLLPDVATHLDYSWVAASRTGNNLINYPYARLTGGGIPENTIQFSADQWSTGLNTVAEDGGGDDVNLGPLAGGSWNTTLTASRGTIDPVTGFFLAGDVTGSGFVNYVNPTFGNSQFQVAVTPPDWMP